jgi:hypothetical protein
MSHTTTTDAGITFHHNGDYSGDVSLRLSEDQVEQGQFKNETYYEIEIPFDAMKELVANYVRSEKISKLEQAEDNEILGVCGD